MRGRPVRWGAGALVAAAALAGCSNSGQTAPDDRATVSVDGTRMSFDALRCTRLQNYLTVSAGQRPGEFTAVFDVSGTRPSLAWVKLRDVGGFSGDVWRGGVGQADAVRRAGEYVVSGSAYGGYASRPAELGVTAPFRITAKC